LHFIRAVTVPPNLPESRPGATILPNLPESRSKTTIPPPNLLKSRPETTIHPPNPPESRLETTIPLLNSLKSRLELSIHPPNLVESYPETPICVLTPPHAQPQALSLLPAEQWQWIQNFNKAIAAVEMETCIRYKEHWFSMDLKHRICHFCFLRDKGNKTPFLMSTDNEMDPGEIPAHLLDLTQVEEMIIA